jgi:hypothetical protein
MGRAELPEGGRFAFVVYLAGDNDLSEEMVWSLQEIKAASGDPSVRAGIDLSALLDPRDGEPRLYDFPLSVEKPLHPPTEDPAGLLERLVARSVGGRRMLVLSGHGSGAVQDFLSDEQPASFLSIPRLGRILEGISIEILGLDSCQMSTIEVGYEVRRSVGYLVASEGPVLNTGWPYRQILGSVAERRTISSAAIARAVAESYLLFYRDYEIAGVSTDIAVSDLSRIGLVSEAVGELARAMTASLSELAADGLEEAIELGELNPAATRPGGGRAVRDAIVLAHWSAQSYKCDRYTDLHDFVSQLLRFSAGRSGRGIDEIRKAAARVLGAIETAVVSSGTTGGELQHSHGLSIYFPWSSRDFSPEYRNLRFAEEAGWGRFLEVYLRATQRMRRFQSAHLKESDAPAVPRTIPRREPGLTETRDVEAGTRKDAEAGTRKALEAKACRSTMKNPPQGYYPPPGRE